MRNIALLGIIAFLAIILYACGLFGTPTANPNPVASDLPALNLAVQPEAGVYNSVGQVIPYTYVVTNTGTASLNGPLTIVDDKIGVTCPDIITVGNKNTTLDGQESITCTSSYPINAADLMAGSVTSHATAQMGGAQSLPATTVVPITLNKVLELTLTADPTSYNRAGLVINFNFTIKNIGAAALGPAQFVISADHIGAVNCFGKDTTLVTNESVTCTASYTTLPNDMDVNQLTFTGTATGGGAGVVQPVTLNITNTNVIPSDTGTNTNPANLSRGSTYKHIVEDGEWLLQITRCYGADYNTVRNANPQVTDPDYITIGWEITVPNIGSNGNIYGKPCIKFYTVQAGDTWASIAQAFNADIAVLQYANRGLTLTSGTKLKIPFNSANGNPVPVPTTSTGGQPIRINFPAGANTTSVSNAVTGQNKVRYVVAAAQGQTLTVKLTAQVNEVELVVSASANAATLKALDAAQTWTGTIPANGDYFIDVISQTAPSKNFTLEVTLATPVPSAFERVADINAGPGDSNPAYLTTFNNVLYFNAIGNNNTGAELWKYDPAQQGAIQAKDIVAGPTGSNPAYLQEYNGALYFSANGNDGAGVELWRFNGTDAGRLGDINNGPGDSNPSYLTVYNNLLYFSANGNDGFGTELWQTDGTTSKRVTDIHNGTGDASPSYLTLYKNALYFSATSNDGNGTELWKFDGTTASLAADINPGAGNSNPVFLKEYNGILYFGANANDNHGVELWKYDGTTASLAADINPGAGDSAPTFLTVFNNFLYFSANANDGAGIQLWKYDGTANPPVRVSDVNHGGNFNPQYIASFNNALFFQANGGDNAGVELWKFKGP